MCDNRVRARFKYLPRAASWNTLGDMVMSGEEKSVRPRPKLPAVAVGVGAIAAFITAGAVSWATPDGNLVVTLVPALAVGLAAFGLALWRVRHGASK